jgi:hypothetical protein
MIPEGNFSFLQDKERRAVYEYVWDYVTKQKLWPQIKADCGKVFLRIKDLPAMTLHSVLLLHHAVEDMAEIQRTGWHPYVERNRKWTEYERKQTDQDMAFFTGASNGKMPSTNCEHGVPFYSCMPCSH